MNNQLNNPSQIAERAGDNGKAKMELRAFQKNVISDLYRKFKAGAKRVCLVAPTAAGKTIMMSQIVSDAASRNRRILVLVDMEVLVSQTADKFTKFGIPIADIGFIKAGMGENRDALIQIASLQTVSRRQWWRDCQFDLIIFDEAHITTYRTTSKKILETFQDSFVLGLTATPWRLSKKEWLGQFYETTVVAPTPAELQKMGFLAPMKYFSLATPDLDGVKTQAGDYKQDELAVAVDRDEALEKAVLEWKRLANGASTICFCVNVNHATHLRDKFLAHGVKADIVTGETPVKERRRLYRELDTGELEVLTSVNVVSIGFDLPSVRFGLLMRPTKSKALHIQQIGRVMRISPETGKQFGTILDFSGNCINPKLGLPEDLTEADYGIGEKKPGDAPEKKVCPQCGALHWGFVLKCDCGFEFPRKEKLINKKELVQVFSKAETADRKRYSKFAKQAFKRNYSPEWAEFQYRNSDKNYMGPPNDYKLGAVFGASPSLENKRAYMVYLHQQARKKNRGPAWIRNWYESEFGEGTFEVQQGDGLIGQIGQKMMKIRAMF